MYFLVCVLFISLSSIQLSNARIAQTYDDFPIVYPGPTKGTTEKLYEYNEVEVPEECNDQTFCTIKPKSYPQEKFNKLFTGPAFVPRPEPDPELAFDNRQGDPDEKDGCESVVTFEPIYNIKTSKGDWRTVIQSPKHNFVQKVRLETCKNTSAKCFTVFPSSPKFETSCRQKYSIWELLVDGENGTETVKVDLPICCSCVYRTSSLGNRSGFS